MLTEPAANAHNAENDWFGYAASSFVFRPIHYLGSKLRVLQAIEQAVDQVDPSGGPICDLFSGSATVSRYLSQRRRVMAVDIQAYAQILASAVLNGDPALCVESVKKLLADDRRRAALRQAVDPMVKIEATVALAASRGEGDPLCEWLELRNLAGLSGEDLLVDTPFSEALCETDLRIRALGLPEAATVCIRHFGGQYFSYAQAADLDAIAHLARENGSAVLLAATLSTASHLVNSVGKQFAQPIRPRDKFGVPKRHIVKKIIAERGMSAQLVFLDYLRQYDELAITRRDHIALKSDFRDALTNLGFKPSVVYADPPYTRDHYSRFYHSLETIALGDNPSITKSNIGGGNVQSRGSYRAGRHQSPFCIKSEAPAAFSALFAGVASLEVPLVLSYSGYDPTTEARPRVMTLDSVLSLAKRHFNQVTVKNLTSLDHMKLNTTSLNKAAKGTTEVLLLCR